MRPRVSSGMHLRTAVATRIRELRTALGLTQADLGSRMGISEGSISRLETGKRAPTLDTIERVALALGVPPHELLTAGPASTSPESIYLRRITSALASRPESVQRTAAAIVEALTASTDPA